MPSLTGCTSFHNPVPKQGEEGDARVVESRPALPYAGDPIQLGWKGLRGQMMKRLTWESGERTQQFQWTIFKPL